MRNTSIRESSVRTSGSIPRLTPTSTVRRLPPSAFRYELIQKARAAAKRIVLPEGDEPRTVKAAICAIPDDAWVPIQYTDDSGAPGGGGQG